MGTGRRTRSWQGVQGEDYVPENCGVPKLSTMTSVELLEFGQLLRTGFQGLYERDVVGQ